MLLAAWLRDKKILPTQTISLTKIESKYLFQIEKNSELRFDTIVATGGRVKFVPAV